MSADPFRQVEQERRKRPAFQFYPADWRKDMALQSCSIAARGLWIETLCIAHECTPYGHLTVNGKPMSSAQVGRHTGLTERECAKLLDELENAGVLSRTDEGVIFSRRMVRDEATRNARAEGGSLGAEHGPKGAEHGRKGGRPPANKGGIKTPLEFGGEPPPSSSSSSSSSSSASLENLATSDEVAPPRPLVEGLVAATVDRPEDPTEPALPGILPTPRRAKAPTIPDCPHLDILDLWAEVLPELPRHNRDMWGGTRAAHLRSRWRESAAAKRWTDQATGLLFFRKFFTYCSRSPFLMGKVTPRDGKRPFILELEWLVNPGNWARVHEGKYHEGAAE